jgi:hypothetical protein
MPFLSLFQEEGNRSIGFVFSIMLYLERAGGMSSLFNYFSISFFPQSLPPIFTNELV